MATPLNIKCYIQQVKSINESKSPSKYFNCSLQTAPNQYTDAVCYSTEHQKQFLSLAERRCPVTLQNVTKTPNKRCPELAGVIISKRSRIDTTARSLGFNCREQDTEPVLQISEINKKMDDGKSLKPVSYEHKT